ncbi:MAG: response regulator transcription factor [Acidobacteria bacterium]|nr:response regulator transcription factor [Acidobacteriota bacterium]
MKTRVLVVEDEPGLGDGLIRVLEEEGYAPRLAEDGASAQALATEHDPELVILDLNIPPPTGLELLRRWRAKGRQMPVLILTARDRLEDRVAGLDLGADDYLTKPFSFGELLARVRTLLRRGGHNLVTRLEAGPVRMDRAAQRVEVAGTPVRLPSKEFALLEYLLLRKGEVVSRADISEHVWDANFDSMSNLVDVTVYRLRKRLEQAGSGSLIHTIKGTGYRLEEAAS